MRILNIKLLIFLSIIQIILNVSKLESVEYISKNEKKIDQLWLRIGKHVSRKNNISIVGMGGGMDKGKVHLLSLRFQLIGKMKKDDARIVIVNIISQLLLEVNQSEELRPYLSNYPFNENNIEISIYLKDKENDEVYFPYLNTLSLHEGLVYYKTLSEDNIYQFKTKEYEPFEEAIQKVQCNE